MKKSQTVNAAEALVAKVRSYDGEAPKTTNSVWRQVITESLGIKKLYTTRLDRILKAAMDMGLSVEGQSFVLAGEPPKDTKLEDDIIPKIPDRPARREVLGRLLEGQLRDRSMKLRKGLAASITFCLCPSCGTELKISGVIEDTGS